jgi:hypothetical protein
MVSKLFTLNIPMAMGSLNPIHTNFMGLLEKPPVAQLFKNFPAFYVTQSFITVFTRALYWSLS